ncbi:MAG TPA: ABC transporter permease [Mucilaginibacter sp.]|jgi:ABC-2 type transport system permease protein|nr:ABC transporter permease [Mucilaginibacter sp.]
MTKYNNTRATLAIAVASFRSIIRSPSAVVFSLAFPLIFIVVFANIGGSGVTVDVGVAKTSDTVGLVYKVLKNIKVIHLITKESSKEMASNLSKGNIDAIINIQKNSGQPPYTLHVQYTDASQQKGGVLRSVLNSVFYQLNSQGNTTVQPVANIQETTIKGREYKYIDFILPGMLGFSLLSSGVFGTAFVFLSLRLTLVIKRFFATPVKRYSIVLGEAIARLVFSWIGALFIILVGHYFFGFTLVHGITTVANMLILSAFGLIIFMGFGFIISGIAKNETTVPPLSNIITMPQFLLSGTFFATTAFPQWLQSLSNILPLTYLNKAMREVAFEGAGLGDVTHELLILGIWFIIVYAVAVKTFKWE